MHSILGPVVILIAVTIVVFSFLLRYSGITISWEGFRKNKFINLLFTVIILMAYVITAYTFALWIIKLIH